MNFAREDEFLNKRSAKSANSPTDKDGQSEFYARVGDPISGTGVVVGYIFVTTDALGPTGWYDRVTVWDKRLRLMWEAPLHNLEGVSYL